MLTAEELAILTGRRRPGRQIEALRQMGIRYLINAANRPIVLRAWVEGREAEPAPLEWRPAAHG